MMVPVLLLGYAWLHIVCCNPIFGNEEAHLFDDLFRSYDKRVRPILNKTDTISVTFGVSLHQIIDVVEKHEMVVCSFWLRQSWLNPLLSWNESRYGGISEINVDPATVWRPDIVLYSNIDDAADGSLDGLSTKITISSSGLNQWLAPIMIKSACKIEILWFPFDEQQCDFKFGSWTHDIKKVDILLEAPYADTAKFVSNGEWELLGMPAVRNELTYICCPNAFPDVTYTLHISRRTMYFYLNMIVPYLLISFLAVLSFWLPSESGERITLMITNLLSLIMANSTISDYIPSTSEVTPLISIYFVVTLIQVGFALFVTCFTVRCHYRSPFISHMPAWFRFLVLDRMGRVVIGTCAMSQYWQVMVDSKQNAELSNEEEDENENNDSVYAKEPYENHREPRNSELKPPRCANHRLSTIERGLSHMQLPRSTNGWDNEIRACHFNQRKNTSGFDEMLQWQAWSHLQRKKSLITRQPANQNTGSDDEEFEEESALGRSEGEEENTSNSINEIRVPVPNINPPTQRKRSIKCPSRKKEKESLNKVFIYDKLKGADSKEFSDVDLRLAEWKLAALIIDKVFMYLFLFLIATTALVVFCQAPINGMKNRKQFVSGDGSPSAG